MSRKTKTGYYCLKIDTNNKYWSLQKTIFDYYYDKDKVDNEVCSVSPRGRGKAWMSSLGEFRMFTDKEIRNYFSKEDMINLAKNIVTRTDKKQPGVFYHYSHNIDNLIKLITDDITEDCSKTIEVFKTVKIQYSHKIK